VKGRFGTGSKLVGLGMGFWVDEGLSWLRVKAFEAWHEVFRVKV
jgi:hypothetical protein